MPLLLLVLPLPLLLLLLVVAKELAEPVVTDEKEEERVGALMKRFGCFSTCVMEVTVGARLDMVGGVRVVMGGGGGGGTVEATVGRATMLWWVVVASFMMFRVEGRGLLMGEWTSCVASVWRGRGRRIVRPVGHKHECSSSGPHKAVLATYQHAGLIIRHAWQAPRVVEDGQARSRQGKHHILTGEGSCMRKVGETDRGDLMPSE